MRVGEAGEVDAVTASDSEAIEADATLDALVATDEIARLITPLDERSVDRSQWPEVRVAETMRAPNSPRTVSPAAPVIEALGLMARNDVNQLPVVTDGHLYGVIARSHVLRLNQTRAELDL